MTGFVLQGHIYIIHTAQCCPMKQYILKAMKTKQKLSFDIFMVGNLQNIFMEHDLYLIS